MFQFLSQVVELRVEWLVDLQHWDEIQHDDDDDHQEYSLDLVSSSPYSTESQIPMATLTLNN